MKDKNKKNWKFSSGSDNYEYGDTKSFGDIIKWWKNRKKKNKSDTKIPEKDNKKSNKSKGRRRIFWITAFVVWFFFLAGIGFGLGFLISLAIWLLLLWYEKKNILTTKFAWTLYTISFLASFLFLGVFTDSIIEPSWEKIENQRDFNTDFTWTDELRQQYVEQEDINEMLISGPFYTGNFPGLDDYSKNYQTARNYKVQEVTKVLDESISLANNLNEQLKTERGLFEWYLFQIMANEASTEKTLLTLLDESNKMALINTSQIIKLEAIKSEVSELPKSAEAGFWTYAKYALLTDTIETMTEEIQFLQSNMLTLYLFLEEDENTYYQNVLNKKVDETMAVISPKTDELIQSLYFNHASLVYEEKMLFTADYWFAKDSVKYMISESEKIKKEIANYKGNHELVDSETLAFMLSTLEAYDESIKNLENYLNTIPENDLVDEQEAVSYNSIFPTAYASWGSPFTYLKTSVESVGNGAWNLTKKGASLGWEATKSTAVLAKDVVVGGAKTIGKGFGAAIDTVDATVKTIVDTSQAMYYDEHPKIVKAKIKAHFAKVYNNLVEGKSGSEIYKNAGAILEGGEDFAKWIVESSTEATIGKGITSTSLGFLTKTTVGFFTGLAKDSYVVLDPTTSDTDTLTSLAGVILSLTGGSQSAINGSTKLIKESVPQATKLLSKLRPTNVYNSLKGTFGKWFTKKAARSNPVTKTIQKKVSDVVINNSKKGIKLIKNTSDEASSAYRGMFSETNYKNAFKGLMGISEATNKKEIAIGFFKNIVGATTDDSIKAQIKKAANYFGISDKSIENSGDSALKDIRKMVQGNLISQIKVSYGNNNEIKEEEIIEIPVEKTKNTTPQKKENIVPIKNIEKKQEVQKPTKKEPTNLGNLEDKLKNEPIGGGNNNSECDDFESCFDEDIVEDTPKGLATAQDCINQGGVPGDFSENLGVSCAFYDDGVAEKEEQEKLNEEALKKEEELKKQEESKSIQDRYECENECIRTNHARCIKPCSDSAAAGLDLTKLIDANKSRERYTICADACHDKCITSCR